ncbi:uncharacterized protein LOC131023546 [Salvia miltiorrhiza]|uniref:uncharacterized protein LOC131023546 n=1 Tax=Salvia miltiorrhiza TaxID=226208 RepID=UPI0025AD0F65|nr:uncharacterized protein LOC131023546 [Salvia miltiorrhiza]
MTTWRMMLNRLPTRDNLKKKRILTTEEESKCNECGMGEESSNHLFLLCPKIEEVWNEIQRWLGIPLAQPNHIERHYDMFINLGNKKKIRTLLLAIWVGTIWMRWKKRNEKCFEGKDWECKNLVLEIKIKLWCWNRIFKIVEEEIDLDSWCSNDIICKIF